MQCLIIERQLDPFIFIVVHFEPRTNHQFLYQMSEVTFLPQYTLTLSIIDTKINLDYN